MKFAGWEVMIPMCSDCKKPLYVYEDEIGEFYTCVKCGAKFPMKKEDPKARAAFIKLMEEKTGRKLKSQ